MKGVVAKALRDFKEKYGKRVSPPQDTLLRKRTPFLEALIQEYFSERVLERKKASFVEGLTYQIFEELLRILFCPKSEGSKENSNKEGNLSTERAIRYIESNLFGQTDSNSIAKSARVSVPTLFRKFKADVGMTPRDYIFRRRMDEARTLLKRGDYKVGDVALLVGYEDIGAFSKAFKSYVGKSPLEFAKGKT